jgi:hypothetical protein
MNIDKAYEFSRKKFESEREMLLATFPDWFVAYFVNTRFGPYKNIGI